MGYQEYLSWRSLILEIGLVGSPILIVLALFLIIPNIHRKFHSYRKLALNTLFFTILTGFFLLLWFHFKIYQNIIVINPINQERIGRFLVPLWIENEKLYFWLLLLGLFVWLRRFKEGFFEQVLQIFFSFFLLLTLLLSNPFLNPLPQFHQEISQYFLALSQPNFPTLIDTLNNTASRMRYFYNTSYMWTHPPMLFISYASFVVSFLACIFMIIKRDFLYEQIAYSYSRFGYLFLSLGILIGYPWAVLAWKGESWWWSPKVNVSLMMWLFYTAYLHSRLYFQRRKMWNLSAILGIVSFLSLVLTYFATYLLPGVHAYG